MTDESVLDELDRLGLPGRLIGLRLKPEAVAGFALTGELVLLPPDFLFAQPDRLDPETLAVGLGRTTDVLRPHGDTLMLGTTLLTLARTLRLHASTDEIWTVLAEAIGVFERLGRDADLGRCLLELGTTLRDHGLVYDALTAYDRAHELLAAADDRPAMRVIHYHRAVICRQTELYEEAILELDLMTALGLADEPNTRLHKAWRAERTACALETGDFERAGTLIDELLAESTDVADFNTALAYRLRARLNRLDGRGADSLRDLASAVVISARSTAAYATPLFRSGEREQVEPLFRDALAEALEQDAPRVAAGILALSRSVRPGAFQTPAADRSDPGPRLAEEQSSLARRATTATLFRREPELDDLARQATTLIDERYVLTYGRAGLDVPDLGALVDRLQAAIPPDHLAVEVFGVDDGVLRLAAITAGGVTVRPARTNLAEAVQLAAEAEREIEARRPCRALDRLGALLLEPLRDPLAAATSVYFVLPDELAGLPLHAADAAGGSHVGYLPALSFLTSGDPRPAAVPGPPVAFVVSDPPYETYEPLPAAEAEADSLPALLPGVRMHAGDEATTGAFAAAAAGAGLLHVSGHAAFEPARPLLSRLLLADRPLFAFEIAGLEMTADLVNLSGCRTAMGRLHRSGDTEGLGAAFLAAGARTVVATRWPVADRAAAAFDHAFYAEFGAGTEPWAAVTLARRRVREEFPDPVDWAAFVALGRPR